MKAPRCTATYSEGEIECDGNKKEKPCDWRTTCRKLRDFCRENTIKPNSLLKMSRGELERMVNFAVETDTEKKESKRGKFYRPPSDKRFNDKIWRLHLHFENMLREYFPDHEIINSLHSGETPVVVATPGLFYPLDRTLRSGYVAWYCKSDKRGGYDTAIANVFLRTRLNAVDIHLPVTISQLQNNLPYKIVSKLDPITLEDGQYKTMCRTLRKYQIGLACRALRKLTVLGIYPLPK